VPDLTFAIKTENQTSTGLSAAKAEVDEAGAAADDASGRFGGLGNALGALTGVAVGVGSAFAAFSTLKGAVDDVDNLAESVKKLADITGATPEAASQLTFAFQQFGINDPTPVLDRFSKGLNGLIENEDGTTSHSSALTDQLKAMGITTQDAAGNTLPMQQILGQLADQFATMPDGPQKTALAIQLFGRSGADLIPLLDQGSAGLQQLYQRSNELGLTLSGSTLDAVHKNELAQREFSAALEGVKVQIGVALLPVLTLLMQGAVQLAEWFTTRAIPAIQQFADWIGPRATPYIQQAQQAVAQIIPQVVAFAEQLGTKLLPIVQQVVAWLDQHHQVALALAGVLATLVAGPIAALIAAGVLIYQHWQDLVSLWNTVKPVVDTVTAAIAGFAQAAQRELQPLLDWVTGTFGPNLQQDFQALVDFWNDVLLPAITATVEFVRDHWSRIEELLQGPMEAAEAVLRAIWLTIKNDVELAIRLIRDVLNAVMDLIHGDWQGAWNSIKDIPAAIWDAINTQIGIAVGLLEGLLKAAWDTIKGDVQVGWDAISSVLSSAWTGIQSAATSAWNGVLHAITGALNSGIDAINGFIKALDAIQIHIPAIGVGPLHTPAFDWNGPGIAQIPHLAAGGIVTMPTLALIGETGPEAVLPLSGGAAPPPALHLHVHALDAAGVMRAIPQLARQLDLHLKRGGGLGLTGVGAARGV